MSRSFLLSTILQLKPQKISILQCFTVETFNTSLAMINLDVWYNIGCNIVCIVECPMKVDHWPIYTFLFLQNQAYVVLWYVPPPKQKHKIQSKLQRVACKLQRVACKQNVFKKKWCQAAIKNVLKESVQSCIGTPLCQVRILQTISPLTDITTAQMWAYDQVLV